MSVHPYFLALFCVASLSAGQIMFKMVSERLTSVAAILNDFGTLGILSAALCLYAVSTLAWLLALRSLPLSQAYLFMSLGFVIVPILANVIFGEKLSTNHILGTVVVVLGLVLATR
jgi:drug/metabolite transporter (DMT)-like permease